MENDNNKLNSNLIESLLSLQIMPKPFGLTWSIDQMKDFLKQRGYSIFERKGLDGEPYYIAVHGNSNELPSMKNGNILETFINEVQKILLGWLIKIGKDV